MFKKMSAVVMVCCMAMPALARAENTMEVNEKIKQLNRELKELQNQIGKQEETLLEMKEKADVWDLSSRFDISGDIRSRLDYNKTATPDYWNAVDVALAIYDFNQAGPFAGMLPTGTPAEIKQTVANFMSAMPTAGAREAALLGAGYTKQSAQELENDTLYTTRLRLNMRVKASENVDIKARVVGYKTWGNQDSVTPETNDAGMHDVYSPYFLNSRSFDGNVGRQPVNSNLVLDRAFMNWNNIAGLPIWFSIGRRPTTDGPPAQLRLGTDQRMATPINYMDYAFDGISLGYAYAGLFGSNAPGRVRFCYGRGFESGANPDNAGMNDVDFAGINWDVFNKGSRFMNIQSFAAMNIFNVPGDTVFPNPLENARALRDSTYTGNTYLDRKNLGNIYHTSVLYMDKVTEINLNWFAAAGWSRTDAKGVDELGISLLNDWGNDPVDKDGYSFYVGMRYDMDTLGLKLGAEFNYGTKNWLAFTPGHDDMYSSKLQTRGKVYEIYGIYDLPTGDIITKYGKIFMRLGYQHYDYDYTYSGMWLGTPTDMDELNDPLAAQFYAPIKEMDQAYLTIEAYF